MRRFLVLVGLAVFGFVPGPVADAGAAGTVMGSVTTNGQKVPLILAYVDESPEDIIVVLASKEVPRDVVPFIGEEVARKLKIHAVAFTVSRAKRAIVRTFGGVFYPGTDMGFVGMAEGVATLQVKRLDATGIEGRIFTPNPVTLSEVTYSFDATFNLPLGSAAPAPPPVAVKVSGDTSPPALAYAEYYRAAMAGDVGKIRAAFVAERRKDFDAVDAQKRGMLLDLMKGNPAEIRIGKPTITGATATVTVEGLNETAGKSTATVTMVNEGGAWKVAKESWSTSSK
ncbi:MAG TPA: hypothetical protein VGK32_22855 [Vicinamibacterales bacterium]|jgi:hypothetical protein